MTDTIRCEPESIEHLRQRAEGNAESCRQMCLALKRIYEITGEQAVAVIVLEALRMGWLWKKPDTNDVATN